MPQNLVSVDVQMADFSEVICQFENVEGLESILRKLANNFPFLDASRITAYRKGRLLTSEDKLHNGDLIELLYDFQNVTLANKQPIDRHTENLLTSLVAAQADIRKLLETQIRSTGAGKNGEQGDNENGYKALRDLSDKIELARKVKVEGRSDIDIRIAEILGKPSIAVRLPGMTSTTTYIPTHQEASRDKFQRIVEADRERILGTENGRKRAEAELFKIKKI
ncbi:hypothetical protein ABW21_db0207813 [Orbilia brochopaga]|nr:hypothetical protein ABW21_db0207813 [Drechslerella brochopaga]